VTKKSMPPEADVSPAVFLKVYRAAMAAQLDMDKINKLIQGALTKHHGLTHAEARLWWMHHLMKSEPLPPVSGA
jgi:hypothetical protein